MRFGGIFPGARRIMMFAAAGAGRCVVSLSKQRSHGLSVRASPSHHHSKEHEKHSHSQKSNCPNPSIRPHCGLISNLLWPLHRHNDRVLKRHFIYIYSREREREKNASVFLLYALRVISVRGAATPRSLSRRRLSPLPFERGAHCLRDASAWLF
jgi:hypothetical protein